MPLQLKNSPSGTPQIEINGRFDFTSNREFRDLCKSMGPSRSCVLNMRGTTYVDSSALGMMLLLKEQVPDVQIVGASPDVKKVLEIANFSSLFAITD